MTNPLPYGCPRGPHVPSGPLSPPLVRSTSFGVADGAALQRGGTGGLGGDFYPRYAHSNGMQFESLVAELEGADGAVAFASGMGAISGVILALCGAGDRVLVAEQIYGGSDALARHDLPRFGIEVERFDALEPTSLDQALRRSARLVLFETPINPTLRIVDVAATASRCRAAGALTVLDSTFAPPPIQRALDLGVDLVVHSATKALGGHSDVMAGVVAGRHELLAPIAAFRLRTGGILGPDAAWLLVRSAATLKLRLAAQQEAAERVAASLAAEVSPAGPLLSVSYPWLPDHPDRDLAGRQMTGGGTVVTIEVAGGLAGANAFFSRLRVFARGPSLGAVESLATLPLYTTHASMAVEDRLRMGIQDGIVRLSIGLEGEGRLLADVRQALEAVPYDRSARTR